MLRVALLAGAGALAVPAASVAQPAASSDPIVVVAQSPLAASAYLRQAAMGDRYEIEAGRIALERSQSDEVRRFAQTMIDQHSRTSALVAAAAAKAGLKLDATLDGPHNALLHDLRTVAAERFDSVYMSQQVVAHMGADALQERVESSGRSAPLREAARQIQPTVQQHLDMAWEMSGAPQRLAQERAAQSSIMARNATRATTYRGYAVYGPASGGYEAGAGYAAGRAPSDVNQPGGYIAPVGTASAYQANPVGPGSVNRVNNAAGVNPATGANGAAMAKGASAANGSTLTYGPTIDGSGGAGGLSEYPAGANAAAGTTQYPSGTPSYTATPSYSGAGGTNGGYQGYTATGAPAPGGTMNTTTPLTTPGTTGAGSGTGIGTTNPGAAGTLTPSGTVTPGTPGTATTPGVAPPPGAATAPGAGPAPAAGAAPPH